MNIFHTLGRKGLAGICLAFAAAGLVGCHSMTGTVSHEPAAYISILGASDGDIATIDGGAPVRLHSGDDNDPIAAKPGKHLVRVSRSGFVVVDREVLVSDQQTLEIRVQ
jgi:hypothetical protein